MSQENQQQNNEGGAKVVKQFEENIKLLTQLLGAQTLSGKSKVPAGEMGSLVEDLFKEETENKRTQLKEKLKNLIKTKVEFDQFVASEKKKLEKGTQDKMSEFNKAAQNIYNDIEGWQQLRIQYMQAAGQVADAGSTSEEV